MCPIYLRIKVSKQEATRRLAKWLGLTSIVSPIEVDGMKALQLAHDNSNCVSLWFYELDGWTVFEDLTWGLFGIPAETWLEFAGQDEFVYAAYNDAICCGDLVVIKERRVVREFSNDRDNPETDVNKGKLDFEDVAPIKSWVEVASFIDADRFYGGDRGSLWILGRAT
jgi:hypothetical protein